MPLRKPSAKPLQQIKLAELLGSLTYALDLTEGQPVPNGSSQRVTFFTDLIAENPGFSAARRRWLKRATLSATRYRQARLNRAVKPRTDGLRRGLFSAAAAHGAPALCNPKAVPAL